MSSDRWFPRGVVAEETDEITLSRRLLGSSSRFGHFHSSTRELGMVEEQWITAENRLRREFPSDLSLFL